jgi:hypothetical protein
VNTTPSWTPSWFEPDVRVIDEPYVGGSNPPVLPPKKQPKKRQPTPRLPKASLLKPKRLLFRQSDVRRRGRR